MHEDRTYGAQRIVAGLYIQPSNDGTRFFVIASYEDGRIHGLEDGPWRATHWAWGPVDDAARERVQRLAEFDESEALSRLRELAMYETGHATKRMAIDAAVKSNPEATT